MKYHSDEIIVAPLTILHDPLRKITPSLVDVSYLYDKQLAEADMIVLNKRDLLDASELARQLAQLEQTYPNAEIRAISARTGEGLENWLDESLARSSAATTLLDIDYKTYADAEAALGWLNVQGQIGSQAMFSARDWMESALRSINEACVSRNIFIAHVKSYLMSDSSEYKASITETGGTILWDSMPENTSMGSAKFIINARVTTAPDELESMMKASLNSTASQHQVKVELESFECFSPLPPEPTYHISLHEL
jgi:G3E family GTPase